MKVLIPLIFLILLAGCSHDDRSQVILVPSSRSVKFLDPNETYRVKVRSAVLDVGYYLELVELENDVAAGRLKRAEP